MDNAAGKLFCAKLESKNLKYTVLEDDYSVIRLGFSLDNTDTDVYFFFGKKCEDMHILCRLNLKIPESKFEKMYKVCNNLNMRFRWLKFFVNEEKRVIQVEDDAVIQVESAADEAFELMVRTNSIIDDVFPEILLGLTS